MRQKILHFLDNGSDSVSVSYSNGGIGSKESAILGMIFLAGFIVFLSMFGVFSTSKNYTKYTNITNIVEIDILP